MSEISRFKHKAQNAKNRGISELRISINEATTLYTEIDNLQRNYQKLLTDIEVVKEQLTTAQECIKETTTHVADTQEINIISQAFKIR